MYKKVEIEWIDSKSGLNAWEYLEDLSELKPAICKTAGYLIEDAKEYKIIAQSLSDTQVHGRIAIPAACIIKLKRIK